MANISINQEAIDRIIRSLDSFVFTEKEHGELDELRKQFRQTYNKQRIENLTRADYFAGLGRKHGCLAYDLEWGTRKLGSIAGGSKYKYGYEIDFPKIKSLLQKIISLDVNPVYESNGSINSGAQTIVRLSKEINGFKTG